MAERKKREWKDFNPNRGTSETNNPLIQKDDWLKSKMKAREGGSSSSGERTKNVAPNGKEYAGPGGGPDARTRAAAGGTRSGSAAMKAEGTQKNFQAGGYTTKTKVDGSSMRDKPLSKSNLQEYKDAQNEGQSKQANFRKPPRRATGREAMIAERYMNQEQKKKDRQSSVVGDS
jgi:hypothetical protein